MLNISRQPGLVSAPLMLLCLITRCHRWDSAWCNRRESRWRSTPWLKEWHTTNNKCHGICPPDCYLQTCLTACALRAPLCHSRPPINDVPLDRAPPPPLLTPVTPTANHRISSISSHLLKCSSTGLELPLSPCVYNMPMYMCDSSFLQVSENLQHIVVLTDGSTTNDCLSGTNKCKIHDE